MTEKTFPPLAPGEVVVIQYAGEVVGCYTSWEKAHTAFNRWACAYAGEKPENEAEVNAWITCLAQIMHQSDSRRVRIDNPIVCSRFWSGDEQVGDFS